MKAPGYVRAQSRWQFNRARITGALPTPWCISPSTEVKVKVSTTLFPHFRVGLIFRGMLAKARTLARARSRDTYTSGSFHLGGCRVLNRHWSFLGVRGKLNLSFNYYYFTTNFLGKSFICAKAHQALSTFLSLNFISLFN